MSIVLLAFPNAPKVSQEAIQKEGELDERLERRIGGENTPVEVWPHQFVASRILF